MLSAAMQLPFSQKVRCVMARPLVALAPAKCPIADHDWFVEFYARWLTNASACLQLACRPQLARTGFGDSHIETKPKATLLCLQWRCICQA